MAVKRSVIWDWRELFSFVATGGSGVRTLLGGVVSDGIGMRSRVQCVKYRCNENILAEL